MVRRGLREALATYQRAIDQGSVSAVLPCQFGAEISATKVANRAKQACETGEWPLDEEFGDLPQVTARTGRRFRDVKRLMNGHHRWAAYRTLMHLFQTGRITCMNSSNPLSYCPVLRYEESHCTDHILSERSDRPDPNHNFLEEGDYLDCKDQRWNNLRIKQSFDVDGGVDVDPDTCGPKR